VGLQFAQCLTFCTSKHPESNGAVERLHCRLKDALHTRAAPATWSEELPFVLLGLRAQPREDNGLSPAEGVFGAQIVLPNELLQNDELSVDTIVKIFSKTLHVSAPSLPRHNSSTDLPSELPAELLSAPLVWVRRGGLIPPLQPLYDSPYAVLRCPPAPSPSESGRMMRWLPSAALRLARPRTPRLAARIAAADRQVRAQEVLPQPSGSRFSSSPAPPRNGPRTVFLPGEEVFARPGPAAPSQPPQTWYPSHQRAPPQRLDLCPLLLPSEARACGEPCGELATPLVTV
jgi:hypothetical protein